MRKVLLTEGQISELVINENLNKRDSMALALAGLIYAGTLSSESVMDKIARNRYIPDEYKSEITAEIGDILKKKAMEDKMAKPKTNAQPKVSKGKKPRLLDDKTIVTVYNAVPSQCNDDCRHTASGYELHLDDVTKDHVVAMERTFMKKLGLKYGDWIRIEGTANGKFDGDYQIQDTMNKRFAGQHKVDILVPPNIKLGGTNPEEYAKIYKI